MAEIDTRPLESVQAALNLFEQRSDSRSSSPDRNEQEIDVVTKELATCKLQLEVKENENKQANLKLEALQKAMQELSEKYDRACLDAHRRIAELEADNGTMADQQSETASECEALRGELTVVRGELDAVKAANAYVLGEVESMETRRILEREDTREALTRILELNDAVLSSAVAAIRAEEERAAFFHEVTLELFRSDRNMEAIRRRQDKVVESMEEELLSKTLEIECLRSDLKQVKELYVSSERAMVLTAATACRGDAAPADTGLVDSTACDGSAAGAADTELPMEDRRNIQSDDGKINSAMSEDAMDMEGREEPRMEVRFVEESSREDFKSVNSDDKDINTGMPEQAAAAALKFAACKSSKAADTTGFVAEVVTEITKDDDDDDSGGEEFYTKEIGEAVGKLDGGYVLVDAKKAAAAADGEALNDGKLDAAHAEISDLRFSLEEAVRRAELAEEAKTALERELRQEIQKKQRPPRPCPPLAAEAVRPSREENAPAPPAQPRPTPPRRSVPPRCLTLGKVLNMKYK